MNIVIPMDNILKQFLGHSGCSIFLMNSEQKYFVRKISASADYNERLKRQEIKQHHFSRYLCSKLIRSPRILNEGYIDGLYYFDMEYVRGINLCSAMQYFPIANIKNMLSLFFNEIQIKSDGLFNNKAQYVFQKKIENLKNNLDFNSPQVVNAFELIANFDFSYVQGSSCCGDLTLENILITRENNIYLIDFLDSFYDSWMIDVAKLLQDMEIGWAYRSIGYDTNCKIRLLIAKQILLNILHNTGVPHVDETVYHILLLNLLRIIPYCRDKNTFTFVEQSISHVTKKLEQL